MLSDKFNKKKTITLAFSIIFISICCFIFTPQYGAGFSFFSSFLFAIGQGGSITQTGVLTRESFGKKNFGSIYGAIMGLGIIGTLIGPFTAGLIFDSYASYHVFWLISIVLMTAALFLIQAVRFISAAKR
jgi:MFS family permease